MEVVAGGGRQLFEPREIAGEQRHGKEIRPFMSKISGFVFNCDIV
jgi:hypothetical protein